MVNWAKNIHHIAGSLFMNGGGYIVHINININVLMCILRLEGAHKLDEIVIKPIYRNSRRILIQHMQSSRLILFRQYDNQNRTYLADRLFKSCFTIYIKSLKSKSPSFAFNFPKFLEITPAGDHNIELSANPFYNKVHFIYT